MLCFTDGVAASVPGCGSVALTRNLLVLATRPLCEDPLNAEWETTQEKENNDKEEHFEPVLQRVFQL